MSALLVQLSLRLAVTWDSGKNQPLLHPKRHLARTLCIFPLTGFHHANNCYNTSSNQHVRICKVQQQTVKQDLLAPHLITAWK